MTALPPYLVVLPRTARAAGAPDWNQMWRPEADEAPLIDTIGAMLLSEGECPLRHGPLARIALGVHDLDRGWTAGAWCHTCQAVWRIAGPDVNGEPMVEYHGAPGGWTAYS